MSDFSYLAAGIKNVLEQCRKQQKPKGLSMKILIIDHYYDGEDIKIYSNGEAYCCGDRIPLLLAIKDILRTLINN